MAGPGLGKKEVAGTGSWMGAVPLPGCLVRIVTGGGAPTSLARAASVTTTESPFWTHTSASSSRRHS